MTESRHLGGGQNGALEIKKHRFFSGINWADVVKISVSAPYIPK
jgi:hypothetical protein